MKLTPTEWTPGTIVEGCRDYGPVEEVDAPFHGWVLVKFRDSRPLTFIADHAYVVTLPPPETVTLYRVRWANGVGEGWFMDLDYVRRLAASHDGSTIEQVSGTVTEVEG